MLILLPILTTTSGLFIPRCYQSNTWNVARQLAVKLNHFNLEYRNLDGVVNQSPLTCSAHPTATHHAQCMPLNDNSNLLMDLCGNNRARDANELVGNKSLCPWRYVVKWSKMRLPHKLLEARLVDDTLCWGEGRRCVSVEHVSPTLWITNPYDAGSSCRYSLRHEKVAIGFTCTLTTA